jgi:trk system potassium uptake protein TrkH
MPEGYFGAGLDVTLLGALFAAVVVVLALAVAALELSGQQARPLALFTLVLIVGAFVWPMVADPLVSGTVIAWALYGFGCILFDAEPRFRIGAYVAAGDEIETWFGTHGPAVRHLLMVSLVASICAVGYGFERRVPAFVTCALFSVVAIGSAYRLLLPRLRERDLLAWAAVVLALAGVVALARPRLGLTILVFSQLALLALIARHAALTRDLREGLYERPAALVTSSFVALILVGTLLLSFPAASASGRSIGLIDALFTATSASCVTGLIVLDTGADFSTFGQAIILLLLQVGGLNIMVLSTFAALLLGRGLGLRGERALGDVLDIDTPGAAYRLIAFIVKVTLAVEAVGAVGMAAAYASEGYAAGLAVWNGVFYAVSAFCNAGFALHADSLVMFQRQPLPLLLMAALITLGGLGFAVMGFLWEGLRERRVRRLAVQSRIVLLASAVLVLVGIVGLLLGEWNASLGGLSVVDKLTNALFQSVTLRTAGFNSVSFENIRPVTVLWMMAFMFIGASPGGTGGGIKTTTAVVLFAAIPAFVRSRPSVVIQGRSISSRVVHQSASIAVASAIIVLSGALLLMTTQTMPFEELLFEAFSAFGTVGLSLGATARLDVFGKVVVILVMLVGRVGPLAITLLLARDYPSRVRYPEARLMVG